MHSWIIAQPKACGFEDTTGYSNTMQHGIHRQDWCLVRNKGMDPEESLFGGHSHIPYFCSPGQFQCGCGSKPALNPGGLTSLMKSSVHFQQPSCGVLTLNGCWPPVSRPQMAAIDPHGARRKRFRPPAHSQRALPARSLASGRDEARTDDFGQLLQLRRCGRQRICDPLDPLSIEHHSVGFG